MDQPGLCYLAEPPTGMLRFLIHVPLAFKKLNKAAHGKDESWNPMISARLTFSVGIFLTDQRQENRNGGLISEKHQDSALVLASIIVFGHGQITPYSVTHPCQFGFF